MKDIVNEGLQQTVYSKDDMEKKIIINEKVNINPHLKHNKALYTHNDCLLYTSPSPRDRQKSRMPSSA